MSKKECRHEWLPLGNDRWSCKNCSLVRIGYVAELKHQLADTEAQNKRVLEKLELLVKDNQDLQQQLAEKDKEIDMLKSQNQFFMEETKRLNQLSNLKDQEIEELKANQTPTRKRLTPKNWDKYNLADKLRYRNSQVKEALIRISNMNEMEDVLRSQLKDQRHQICDRIREFVKYGNDIKTDKELAFAIEDGLYFEAPIRNIFEVLDQIEKGE